MKPLGHRDTAGTVFTFGKHKGKDVAEIPDGYLRWFAGQDWAENEHEELFETAQEELRWRNETGQHWEE
jgi:uncharacterized protein (DUF3820 family)